MIGNTKPGFPNDFGEIPSSFLSTALLPSSPSDNQDVMVPSTPTANQLLATPGPSKRQSPQIGCQTYAQALLSPAPKSRSQSSTTKPKERLNVLQDVLQAAGSGVVSTEEEVLISQFVSIDFAQKKDRSSTSPDDLQKQTPGSNQDATNDYNGYESSESPLPTPYRATQKYQDESESPTEDTTTTANDNALQATLFPSDCDAESNGIKWYKDADGLTKNGIGKPIAPHQRSMHYGNE